MNKHLFLEGPIQTGKSTLLRRCLAPYRKLLGGFSVQRLLAPDGSVMAYRMTSAGNFCLQQEWHASLPGIFLQRTAASPDLATSPAAADHPAPAVPPAMEAHPEVFAHAGIGFLQDSANHPLMLLDEIGGIELLVPAFRHALFALLASDTPCIGVMKQQKKAVSLRRAAACPAQLDKLHCQLRHHLLKRWNAKILSFPAEGSSADPDGIRNAGSHTVSALRQTIDAFLTAHISR